MASQSRPMASMRYIASLGANQIAVYDAKREQVGIVDVPGGDNSQVNRRTRRIGPMARRWLPRHSSPGSCSCSISPIPPSRNCYSASLRVSGPGGDFTPDGAEVWVPNQRSNNVTVIDARGAGTSSRQSRANSPNRMHRRSGDGRLVFVANHNTTT